MATQFIVLLDQCDVMVLVQQIGTGEAGNTGADNADTFLGHGFILSPCRWAVCYCIPDTLFPAQG